MQADDATPSWPMAVLDAEGTIATYMAAVPPSEASRRYGKRKRATVIENEPGLCDRMAAAQAACKSMKLEMPSSSRAVSIDSARAVRAQSAVDFPLQPCKLDHPAALCAPLLFSSLISTGTEDEAELEALGAKWRLPARAAFFLSEARRWHELRPLRPAGGGFRLILLDPPWHSRSVQRAQCYATSNKRDLLADLAPAIEALACPSACLILCWVTNNRRVQSFAEETLFSRIGAVPIGRWYWAKLSASGEWAQAGADPHSPHRKPWEPLLLGLIGGDPASLGLPTRLVFCSVPGQHSAKPSLEQLLVGAAPALLGEPEGDQAKAWSMLPKFEGFARCVRQGWTTAGNEVLHGNFAG